MRYFFLSKRLIYLMSFKVCVCYFSHKSSQSKTERGEYYTQKNFHEHFLSQKYDVLINNIIFIEITYEKRVQVS